MVRVRTRSNVRHEAFTLIELLTVIFIIGVLIAILIPSLTAARNAAKKASTSAVINNALRVGIELFKSENEKDFVGSNGYPPSFAHPKIGTYAFEPSQGQCPYVEANPTIYGAQWLPVAMVGVDRLGYIQRSSIPASSAIANRPPDWYRPNPLNQNPPSILPRSTMYVDPGNSRLAKLTEVPGTPNRVLFPDWSPTGDTTPGEIDHAQEVPVFLDAFDQPILYYVANKYGTTANMVEDVHSAQNNYGGSAPQQSGQPYYFHQDNVGFTGRADGSTPEEGWQFVRGAHGIARSGHDLTAQSILTTNNEKTFARFILDTATGGLTQQGGQPTGPLRPVNADTYLLISAGVDGLYGTKDDVTNFRMDGR